MGFASRFVTSIDANRTIKDELTEAIQRQGGRRRISVTDLVNPRQAFFRRTRPDIEPSPERLQLMLSGAGFHDLFGKAVSTEEFVEQFVEFEGIVGKIDIYVDVPTELKTTGFIPSDVLASRPGYIDQLGMYCTMTGRSKGCLIIYKRSGTVQPGDLRAFDVTYDDIQAIASEMVRRRNLLQDALLSGSPASLPRCEWFETGCDYESLCGCEDAAPPSRVVPPETVTLAENPRVVAVAASHLERRPEPSPGFKLNDLVFPRKAAFERKAAPDHDEAPESEMEVRLASLERRGFYGAMSEALRFGVRGSFSRIPVELRTVTGWVASYRGVPTIIRSTKLPEMVNRARVPVVFGHYVDRLALECALTGNEQGRIVVYYESLPEDKFMVYELRFRDLTNVLAEADRRLALLEAGATPRELPPCPAWLAKYCSFAPACACAKDGAS